MKSEKGRAFRAPDACQRKVEIRNSPAACQALPNRNALRTELSWMRCRVEHEEPIALVTRCVEYTLAPYRCLLTIEPMMKNYREEQG